MQVIRWQERQQPQEQELRKRMREQGLSPYAWSNGPGERYGVHSHSYVKVLFCVSGSICFVLLDQLDEKGETSTIDLEPGDCMILPAGVRHSALVGRQGVTCLEAQQEQRRPFPANG